MRKVFRALRSLKLTIALLALIILISAVSTFLSADGFFRSPWFLIPAGFFFLNLLACAAFRFLREFRKPESRDFGPDIIHAALIVFLLSAALSGFGRSEGIVTLHAGEGALLPNGNPLVLTRIERLAYADGSLLSQTSYVSLPGASASAESGEKEGLPSRPLSVNHPIRTGSLLLYQSAWGSDAKGEYSVIRAVYDPGLIMVMISLAIAALGVFLTLFQRFFRKRKGVRSH